MQIASTPHSGTAASLSIANRQVGGQQAVETRSRVMPAVQQPVEVEAAVNRQNPANRPTLVDEEVRLYGPFNSANNAATAAANTAEPVVVDAAPPDIVVDDQAQNQQSGRGSEQESQAAADTDAIEAATSDAVRDESADTLARNTEQRAAEQPAVDQRTVDQRNREQQSAERQSQTRASAAEDADKKADSAREVRIQRVEQQQISRLAARDREVRAHEAAHASIGGQYAGGASFTLKQGPNGVSYAVGGEVPIDLSAVADDPEATIRKMQTVQRAALAPAEPSSADRAAAAQAAQIAQQARAQIQSDQSSERATRVESARQQRAEAEEKRAAISDRMTDIQNNFNFSNELEGIQRSRQVDILAQNYGPLRPGTIGTLLDERV